MKIQSCKYAVECQECDCLLARSEKRLVDNGLHYCFKCRGKLRANKGARTQSSNNQLSPLNVSWWRRWWSRPVSAFTVLHRIFTK